MFKNTSLKTKLFGLCLFLSALTAVVGGMAWVTVKKMITSYEHITKDAFPNSVALANMRAFEKDAVIVATRLYGEHTSAAENKEDRDLLDSFYKAYEEQAKLYEALPSTDLESEKWNEVKKNWDIFKETTDKLLTLSDGVKEHETERDQIYMAEYAQIRKDMMHGLLALIENQKKDSDFWSTSADAESSHGLMVILILSTCSLILALVFGYFFSNSLAKSLTSISEQLSVGGREVASASNQISDSASKLSASTTEQASALQETVASIDEISAMIAKNADNAKRSQETASVSHQAASKGKQAVEQMVSSIGEISKSNTDIMQQINASNQDISGIVKIIGEIGNKTKVINDIVFQTKLLSFNASVEAARAGEHGKGFAVVAEEVGNLAQMSGNAAKEISQMLEESISKVEMTVNGTKTKVDALMATGRQKVEAGISIAQRCGQALDEIVVNVENLTMMVNEISTASQEQSQGVQEITKAMGQLDEVTQENASASQQASQAGEELNAQAAALHRSVAQLVQMVSGKGQSASGDSGTHTGSISLSKTSPQTKQEPKLLAFKKAVPPKGHQIIKLPNTAQKKASGSEYIPAEDDPRFKDL